MRTTIVSHGDHASTLAFSGAEETPAIVFLHFCEKYKWPAIPCQPLHRSKSISIPIFPSPGLVLQCEPNKVKILEFIDITRITPAGEIYTDTRQTLIYEVEYSNPDLFNDVYGILAQHSDRLRECQLITKHG